MQYLSYFLFPTKEVENSYLWNVGNTCSYYPFRVLSNHNFERIDFEPVTILYGDNGSGKSTALNAIAEKIGLRRDSVWNRSAYFQDYVNLCGVSDLDVIPPDSRMVTSDDVFDFMLDVRSLNDGISVKRKQLVGEFLNAKYAKFQLKSIEDYDRLKQVNQARSLSQSKYVRSEVMETIAGHSNGETAFRYFVEKMEKSSLYLLDEPENSLSPKRQIELKGFIEDSVRFFGCQFVISTHSPFLLSIENARIYNLDANPVSVQDWTELESVKTYCNFFRTYQDQFQGR